MGTLISSLWDHHRAPVKVLHRCGGTALPAPGSSPARSCAPPRSAARSPVFPRSPGAALPFPAQQMKPKLADLLWGKLFCGCPGTGGRIGVPGMGRIRPLVEFLPPERPDAGARAAEEGERSWTGFLRSLLEPWKNKLMGLRSGAGSLAINKEGKKIK